VLATNIAETAITIEDVTCVINSGRLKEKSYDPYTAVSTLQAAWISKARTPSLPKSRRSPSTKAR
jgi:HrpA-like RNA helicase